MKTWRIHTHVKRIIKQKAYTLCLTSKSKHQQLREFFQLFILEFSSVLEKQSLFCFALYCEYLWLYIKYSNLIQFLVIVKSSLIKLWLSIGSLFQLWLSKGSLLELSLSRKVSFLCDWATCNLTLHFSGTLLGSARGTGLLLVCGRNLYNCLCSLFLCSILYYLLHKTLNSLRLWTSSDSEPKNSSWTKEKRSFWNTQYQFLN